MIENSSYILPCPFCGGEASMSYSGTLDSPEPAHRFLECDECGASGASAKMDVSHRRCVDLSEADVAALRVVHHLKQENAKS